MAIIKYSKSNQFYEGKAKKLFSVKGYPELVIQDFKDDATAFNALKKGTISNKGVINNDISEYLFKYLSKKGIPNHLVARLSDREMLVKKVRIVPIEVVVRNIAAGSLLKKTNLKEGQELSKPIIEFYYKDDPLGDPMITESHALAMKIATESEMKILRKLADKINSLLKPFFLKRRLKLVDFKLEFGRLKNGKIILADEISPDTCRFWDSKTNKKLDKDRFRFDLGEVNETYVEVRNRVLGIK